MRKFHIDVLSQDYAPRVVVRVSTGVAHEETYVVEARRDRLALVEVEVKNVPRYRRRPGTQEGQRQGDDLDGPLALVVHDAVGRADEHLRGEAGGDLMQHPDLDQDGGEHSRSPCRPAEPVAADRNALQVQTGDVQVRVEGVPVLVQEHDAPVVPVVRGLAPGVVDVDAEGVRLALLERGVLEPELQGLVHAPRSTLRHAHEAQWAHPGAEDPVARVGRRPHLDVHDLGRRLLHGREREKA
mmetsp:Transcript_102387/g.289983  ORF Transcript_102387/g.289983 Transcript_102387/m.289983 type:complete len:241 (-) Transcript_102387:495-1217(-)